jgi:unspecific monooxygenase
VAGQENPQLALLSTLYLLAKNPDIQDQLYAEATAEDMSAQPSEETLRNMPFLTACVYESLRLMPPIGQLVNRLATTPLVLGDDMVIPEGTYIGYNSYATNRDPEVWGKDADEFVPARWGHTTGDIQTHYRRSRARAEFISFHGGRRACLGERFAVLQLKVTVFTLVRNLRWKLDPEWPDRMTPVSSALFSHCAFVMMYLPAMVV